MSIALVVIDKKLKEIVGNQYIYFNKLEESNETEIRVVKDVQKETIDIFDSPREVTIIRNVTTDICYYDKILEITNKNKYFRLKGLEDSQNIIIDGASQTIINNSNIKIYKNYSLMQQKEFMIEKGDVLHFEDIFSIVIKEEKRLEVNVYQKNLVTNNLPSMEGIIKEYKDFPIYTNSPKMNYKLEEEQINLQSPPEKEKKSKVKDIVKKVLPPLVTMSLTLVLAYFKPRGPYIIISMTATIMTLTFSITAFIEERKENKIFNAKRKEIYQKYLYETRSKLTKLKEEEIQIRNYQYLSDKAIKKEIKENSSRLYERNIEDEDFLKIRIGLINDEPVYKLKSPIDELKIEKEKEELELEELYNDFKELENVPRVINILENNVGLIGSKSITKEQIKSMLMQIIYFQSYLDVKIMYVINENELKDYNAFKYVKHSQIGEENLYNYIYNNQTRDTLLSPIVQMFRAREEAIREKKAGAGLPIFVFVISNYELIANHSIMEFLQKDARTYGFVLLFMTDRRESLIDNIDTVIEYKNKYTGEIIIESNVVKHEEFKIEEEDFGSETEILTRKLGQLEHVKGVQSAIPEAITFLEMYGIEKVEDLTINRRWSENKTYKTIKALLGKKSETDEVYLDLHEKVHGPHGLLAGTTGSGKSEVLQTYILSLAVNYSPYDVGFLLIDYKGGGMANLFKDMPHLLGSITNLDGYQAMRAMASIKSELKRRQTIFSAHEVNHINGYHKLFEKGTVKEPLPHLFLISDEFAELKANEPEFMKELVSTARIGRSLGVHMILGTQKPSGVVDDQIWSNSKFKLCLKVAEESDSKELLKTPDAAYITQPGRGYLKVGTNELYELFQTGYSGADYSENKEEERDLRVFLVDKMGQGELVNKDLSGKEKVQEEEITELDAVLNEVTKVYESKEYIEVTKPWLPPLGNKILMPIEVRAFEDRPNVKINIGLIDLPDRQAQQQLELDFEQTPTLTVLGGPSTGKTKTIMTTMLQLALQNDANMLDFYVLDFGSSGLIQTKMLKQTADYIKIDEVDKINKFKKEIQKKIQTRKKLLEKKMVSNVKAYNQVSDNKIKATFVVIDNYDIIRDEGIDPNYEIVKLIKDGLPVGIYPIISVTRMGAFNISMQSIMTNRIVHYVEERTELSGAIGRSEYAAQEIQGRVQLKLEKPEVAQIYFVSDKETEEEIIQDTTNIITKINEACKYKNEPLPQMPKVVEYKLEYKQDNKIFVGLDYEDIKPQYIEYENLLVYGSSSGGKSSVIKDILAKVDKEVYIIDDDDYTAHSKQISGKIHEIEKAMELFEVLSEELKGLTEVFAQKREENPNYTFHDYKKEVDSKIIYVNQAHFLSKLQMADKAKFISVINDLSKVGYMIIYEVDNIMEMNDVNKIAKECKQKIYVGDPAMQTLVKLPTGSKATKSKEVYLFGKENKKLRV